MIAVLYAMWFPCPIRQILSQRGALLCTTCSLSYAAPPAAAVGVTTVETWNWAGFVYCVGGVSGTQCPDSNANSGVTQVIGQWTVPNVASTSLSDEYSSTWIGIGGNNPAGDLVQMGTEEDVASSGAKLFSTWWEMLPNFETVFKLSGGISPGDTIYAKVSFGGQGSPGPQVWNFFMKDVTTGASSSFSETCSLNCIPSTFSSADFIQESTCIQDDCTQESDISQLPAFTQTNFWNDQIFVGRSTNGFYLGTNLSGNLINVVIDNPYYLNVAVGLASSLGTGEFWTNYLVSVGDCLASQSCYALSANSVNYGQTLKANLQLYSVSSFSHSTTNLGLGMSIRSSNGALYSNQPNDVYGLSISSGTATYARQFSIDGGEIAGAYEVTLAIWYIPFGGSIGGAGSLQIATNGFSSSILTITATEYPTVTTTVSISTTSISNTTSSTSVTSTIMSSVITTSTLSATTQKPAVTGTTTTTTTTTGLVPGTSTTTFTMIQTTSTSTSWTTLSTGVLNVQTAVTAIGTVTAMSTSMSTVFSTTTSGGTVTVSQTDTFSMFLTSVIQELHKLVSEVHQLLGMRTVATPIGQQAKQIIVTAAPFDFSVSNSGGVTVTHGSSGANKITVTLTSGSTQSVGLSCSGLPSGASCSFNHTSADPSYSSALTITTSSSTPKGPYTITVTATGGGKSHTTQFTLTTN